MNREGRPLCRPTFLLFVGVREWRKNGTGQSPSLPDIGSEASAAGLIGNCGQTKQDNIQRA